MFRCIECYLTKTARDPISVAIKLLYCMILTVYLSYLYKYLLPIAVMPFIYIRIKLKKNILKRLIANSMNNFQAVFSFRRSMLLTGVAHTKPLSRLQSLFESRGGSRVTKPIFSNSAKCYSLRWRIRGERAGNLTFSLGPRDPKRFGRAE